MKNSSNNSDTMKYYLLSDQDLKEIYWVYELMAKTIAEILKRKEVHEQPEPP